MEVDPARKGINRFGRPSPIISEAGQDNQVLEKHWNHLLISPLDDGLPLGNQPNGTAAHYWWGRLHR